MLLFLAREYSTVAVPRNTYAARQILQLHASKVGLARSSVNLQTIHNRSQYAEQFSVSDLVALFDAALRFGEINVILAGVYEAKTAYSIGASASFFEQVDSKMSSEVKPEMRSLLQNLKAKTAIELGKNLSQYLKDQESNKTNDSSNSQSTHQAHHSTQTDHLNIELNIEISPVGLSLKDLAVGGSKREDETQPSLKEKSLVVFDGRPKITALKCI